MRCSTPDCERARRLCSCRQHLEAGGALPSLRVSSPDLDTAQLHFTTSPHHRLSSSRDSNYDALLLTSTLDDEESHRETLEPTASPNTQLETLKLQLLSIYTTSSLHTFSASQGSRARSPTPTATCSSVPGPRDHISNQSGVLSVSRSTFRDAEFGRRPHLHLNKALWRQVEWQLPASAGRVVAECGGFERWIKVGQE